MTGNVIVGQSGGPTAVINASVAGVYLAAKKAGAEKIYGMVYGIQGFLEDKLVDLDVYLCKEENVELLKRSLHVWSNMTFPACFISAAMIPWIRCASSRTTPH